MPQAIPIILGVVAATETGLQIAGVGQPSPGDAAKQQQEQLQKAQQAQAAQDAQQRQKAILANLANAQEQGGGALNAPSLTDLAAIIAGLPGEATSGAGKGALSQYLGLPSSTSGVVPNPSGGGGSEDTMVGRTFGLSGSQG